jgi:hypothetical protein
MDFYAADRDEIANRMASALSEALSFEGIRHFLYLPNEVNDGVALISDSQQPFDNAKFEYLIPRKWDIAVSHMDEDGSKPFGILRVFAGDFHSARRIDLSDVMATARIVAEAIR